RSALAVEQGLAALDDERHCARMVPCSIREAEQLKEIVPAPVDQSDQSGRDRLTATSVDLMIRLGVLGLLLYYAFVLVRPFITIAIWSVVLAVALYPFYERVVNWLGGRRRLAAVLVTLLSLVIVVGPAAWLAVGLIDSVQVLSSRLDPSVLVLP